jgi:Phage portal protein, SPP1 Gp6-like
VLDVTTPDSVDWWLARLHKKLDEVRPGYQLLDDYYTGVAPVPTTATRAVRQAYQRLMRMSRTNFAELVVEALRERVSPSGFRTGAAGDELDDKVAWGMWQANSLDADFALITSACFSMGVSYGMVGDVDEELGVPVMTPEDPRQVIIEADPVRRRKAIAGLKTGCEDGVDVAYLYLPGEVYRFAKHSNSPNAGAAGYELDAPVMTLDAPIVPIVRFACRPNMRGTARGEFEPHLGILDRINYTVLSRLEIATLQAFKQRAIKGLPDRDETGAEINYDDVFAADPGALWQIPATADIWESGSVDLGPIRQAIRDDVQDLAAVTRTPLFYLSPDSASGSAEGASLAREGLVFKAKDRLLQLGESVEQWMSYAFLIAGDTDRAARADMQVLWSPPERFTLAERYDAATKAQAAGVPWRTVMQSVLQFSPEEIERMEAERAADALLAPMFPIPETLTAVTKTEPVATPA